MDSTPSSVRPSFAAEAEAGTVRHLPGIDTDLIQSGASGRHPATAGGSPSGRPSRRRLRRGIVRHLPPSRASRERGRDRWIDEDLIRPVRASGRRRGTAGGSPAGPEGRCVDSTPSSVRPSFAAEAEAGTVRRLPRHQTTAGDRRGPDPVRGVGASSGEGGRLPVRPSFAAEAEAGDSMPSSGDRRGPDPVRGAGASSGDGGRLPLPGRAVLRGEAGAWTARRLPRHRTTARASVFRDVGQQSP